MAAKKLAVKSAVKGGEGQTQHRDRKAAVRRGSMVRLQATGKQQRTQASKVKPTREKQSWDKVETHSLNIKRR